MALMEFGRMLEREVDRAHREVGYPLSGLRPVSTKDGIFEPADIEELIHQLPRIGVSNGKRFCDLGGGDARVCFIVERMGLEAASFETDTTLNMVAGLVGERLYGGNPRVHLRRENFLDADLGGFDVFFYFDRGARGRDERTLIQKLKDTMKPDDRLIVYRERDDKFSDNGFIEVMRIPGEVLVEGRVYDTVVYRKPGGSVLPKPDRG